MISFTVLGIPQPAGSKRGFAFKRKTGGMGVAITDANPKSRDYKNAVASAALDAMADHEEYTGIINSAVELRLAFYLPRPKGHFGKRGLRDSAPRHITTKPDVLKLARAVEDALTSILYRDDSQIVSETLEKHYGEPARCEVTLTEVPT